MQSGILFPLFIFLVALSYGCLPSAKNNQEPISSCSNAIINSFFSKGEEFKNSLSNCISSLASKQLKINQSDAQILSDCIADVIISSRITSQRDSLSGCMAKAGQKLFNVKDTSNFLNLMETISKIYSTFK